MQRIVFKELFYGCKKIFQKLKNYFNFKEEEKFFCSDTDPDSSLAKYILHWNLFNYSDQCYASNRLEKSNCLSILSNLC